MKKVLVLFILLFMLLIPATALAESTDTEAGTTPDSLFYWFDKMAERIFLLFTFDPQDKAEALSKIGLERLAEAEESDNEETIGKLISEFVKNNEKAEALAGDDLDTLVGLNEDQAEALDILSELIDDEGIGDKGVDRAISSVIKLLDKQSSKLEKLALSDSSKTAEKVARVIDKTTAKLNKLLEKFSKDDEDDSDDNEKKTIEELIEHVQSSTSKHIAVLESLLDKVPDSARASIEKAIEKSMHGSKTTSETVGRRGPKAGSDGEASQASSKGGGNGKSKDNE